MVTDKSGWVRIPKIFINDHADRGLETPVIQKETKSHYWIDPSDRAVVELVDDAVYYAHDVDACDRGLTASARATLAAMR